MRQPRSCSRRCGPRSAARCWVRSAVLPYAEIGTIHNDPTVPSAHATAGILLHQLTPETVRGMLAVAGPDVAAPLAIVEIRHLGGALRSGRGPA